MMAMLRRLNGRNDTTMNYHPFFILKEKKRRLVWAEHALRKHESLIREVIEENPIRERPLGRSRLRWKDCIKKYFETMKPNNR